MNEKITQELHKKYPEILATDGKSLLRMGVFEYLDGWAELPEKFLQAATELVMEARKHYPEAGITSGLIAMKEKYGTLRIQGLRLGGCPDIYQRALDGFVEQVFTASAHVCEICGQYGELRTELRWVQTLCDPHNREARQR